MKINFLKAVITIFSSLLIITSCSSDDENSTTDTIIETPDDSTSECASTPTDQVAQGNFEGDEFISPGGRYMDTTFDGDTERSYFCAIYTETPLASTTSCRAPQFTGSIKTIIFSINSLEANTYTFSNNLASGGSFDNTLNFNLAETNVTNSDLACGTVIIDGLNDLDQLTGSIIAESTEGSSSSINGNFVLDFCE